MFESVRMLVGTRVGLFAGWLYDHGFDNRLWFVYEAFRKLCVRILPPNPNDLAYPWCECGCPARDHHTSIKRDGTSFFGECLHFGFNETGGMRLVKQKWVEHCYKYRPMEEA